MVFDSELEQLKFLNTHISGAHLYSANSFEKRILNCFRNIDKFRDNSGHDKNPPDFYSNELNIMFDIFRVNDSEVKRSYNPTAIAERKMQREVEQSWIADNFPNVSDKLFCIDENYGSVEIHTMEHYRNNVSRVIKEHLTSKGHPNKIKDIWEKEHPTITQKGLVIFDETENYFQGQCIKDPGSDDWVFINNTGGPWVIYEPWNDKDMVEPVYLSDCDFLVWFMPYKYCGTLVRKLGVYYPTMVILDTRYLRTDYVNYDHSVLVRS